MEVEVADNKIVLNMSKKVDSIAIQRLIDYAHYLEASAGSQATPADVEALADEVNANWWAENKGRFGF